MADYESAQQALLDAIELLATRAMKTEDTRSDRIETLTSATKNLAEAAAWLRDASQRQ